MKMIHPIDMVSKTVKFICQRCSTNEKVNQNLIRSTVALDEEGPSVEEWFPIDSLRTL